MKHTSKVINHDAYRWKSIAVRVYKSEEAAPFKDVTRQTLLGEGAGEEDLSFITRYFEIQPGGFSSLEMHGHPHAVIVLRGTGQAILGGQVHDIEPYDCVYVSPWAVHQFRATGEEPLGFLCMVDRVRDRPRVADTQGTEAE